ncbi:MAG: type II toxin-antitoxin system HicA family toxin [Hoeflea sp.]|uniref:type II toxin-antitoxin system HicA family toxin n=1 Tax=Hoeflea sp. TaxID=1940281 RepID=UPI00329913B7|tara:strand:+ start:5434 stop:5631 length:198 start_codon:yes stop_codon:yes gene_type:complete
MVSGFYRVVCDELARAGFAYLGNAKGSHEKWQNAQTGRLVLVPRNLKSRHTANAILKSAGLGKKF